MGSPRERAVPVALPEHITQIHRVLPTHSFYDTVVLFTALWCQPWVLVSHTHTPPYTYLGSPRHSQHPHNSMPLPQLLPASLILFLPGCQPCPSSCSPGQN